MYESIGHYGKHEPFARRQGSRGEERNPTDGHYLELITEFFQSQGFTRANLWTVRNRCCISVGYAFCRRNTNDERVILQRIFLLSNNLQSAPICT